MNKVNAQETGKLIRQRRTALGMTQKEQIMLIVAFAFVAYLFLSQLISFFTTWFSNRFVIEETSVSSILPRLPGLLLNQVFLVCLTLILLWLISSGENNSRRIRLGSALLVLSGFLISLLSFWLKVSGNLFEYGSHFLIGLSLFLFIWDGKLFLVRISGGLAGLALLGELSAHLLVLFSQESSLGLRIAVIPMVNNRVIACLFWCLVLLTIHRLKPNSRKSHNQPA